jgi:hypothetical protein
MKFTPASETAKQEVLEYAKEHLSIEDAKKILEKNGYFVANLWHVEDVTAWAYDCDEDTAQEILYKALTSDHVSEAVWDSIDYFAEELNINRK